MTSHPHLLDRLRLPAICSVAVLAMVLPLFAADSEFSDLPPTPSSGVSKYSPALPPAGPATPAVKTVPATVQAVPMLVAQTTPVMPVVQSVLAAPSVAKTNAIADTSTDISTNAPDVPLGTPINGMDGLDDNYRLSSGDTINYQVVEDEDDVKTLAVTDSGDIEVPYLGRFPAVGKTCKELARQLKAELQKKYYYQATVIISVNAKASQGVIYLVGGVRTPGPLEMPRDDVLTVSKAILRAGGFDDFADSAHVRITRGTESGTNIVLTVNVSSVINKGKTKNDPQVEPGDLIFVPEKTFRF
jgi:polysaccharide export outer membrane protein